MKILFLSVLFISTLLSQTTMCYKENSIFSKIDTSMLLDGKVCQGKLSATNMKSNNWDIQYSQVTKKDSGYNHLIMFKKADAPKKTLAQKKIIHQKQIQAKSLNFNLKTKEIELTNVNKNIATINVGDLKIGQSGIIIHKYAENKSLIIANATVQSSSNNQSTLILSNSNNLVQNAIPTSNLQPKTGDIFILNHMYNSSLLIVPNFETSQNIQELYPTQNFLNPDIFAANLKIEANPVPTAKDIQIFCKAYDIGTVFIVANNILHILDVNTLKTINKTKLYISNTTTQSPFFTKITEIKTNFWDFGDDKITDYNSFYLSLINNTKYQPKEILNNEESNDDKSLFTKMMEMLPW